MLTVEQRFNAWLSLPIDDRRDYIRARFHIVLHPHSEGSARTFDPNTVSVHAKRPGDSRRVLSGEDIAGMQRVSLGQEARYVFQNFRDNRRGNVYDRKIKHRESFERLLQEHPGLAQLLERRRKERGEAIAGAE
jgi:hypothetical protein